MAAMHLVSLRLRPTREDDASRERPRPTRVVLGGHSPAAVERDDGGGDRAREGTVVRTQYHRGAARRFVAQDLPEALGGRCVEPGGGLVEEEEPWRVHESPSKRDPLALTA